MRPIGKIDSVRSCGAVILTSLAYNIFINNLPVCTMGSTDSHQGIAVTGHPNIFANNIPVCGLGDVNDFCKRKPPHIAQPLRRCDDNVFIA